MKYKSRTPKPETGMELSVSLMMPADHSSEQSRDALLKFFEGVERLSGELGAGWLKINCSVIPEELESALQAAFNGLNKRPNLTLVVDNATPEQREG